MTVKPMKALEIFYSYASKDEALQSMLEKQLGNLKQQGLISDWHQGKITAGVEHIQYAGDHLRTASIILLLISPDFLASDYCYSVEMKGAMERHEAGEARVIPVLLRPTDWKGTPFEKLSVLPSDGNPVTCWRNRDQAFLNIAQGIRSVAEEIHDFYEKEQKSYKSLRERYCQAVIEYWEVIDFKGIMHIEMNRPMSIPLTDIFIFPDILTGVPEYETLEREERDENAQILEKEQEAASQISDQTLSGWPLQSKKQLITLQRKSLSTVLAQSNRLVILGDPGSGKSTLLRYILLCLAKRDATFFNAFPHFIRTPPLIPLYITLASYSEFWRSSSVGTRTLKHFLPQYLSDNYLHDYNDFLQHELEHGNMLLLLDGLDEISNSLLRLQIVRQVEAFTQAYSQNQFIITSRIVGYKEAPLALGYQPYTLADFNKPQIQLFTQLWCPAYERWIRGTQNNNYSYANATKEAKNLFNATQSNLGIKRLAGNPLLLTILALIQRQGREIPSHRIELFDLCATTLLETWVRARGQATQISKSEIIRIIRPLAFWMHKNLEASSISERDLIAHIKDQLRKRGIAEDDVEIRAERFLQTVHSETGILIERGRQRYSFLHLTFEEYFAASELEQNENLGDFIRQYLHDARWREILLLTMGIVGIIYNNEKGVTKLLHEAILQSNSPFERWLHRDLLFAGLCLADDIGPSVACENEIIEQIIYLYITSPYDTLRESFSSVLRLWKSSPVAVKAASAVLPFLLQQIASEDTSTTVFPTTALHKRFQEKMMQYHQSLIEEFILLQKKLARFLTSVVLLTDTSNWIEVGDALLSYPDPDVREVVVKILREVSIGQPTVMTLFLQALTDSDWQVREEAVKALAEASTDQSAAVVKALLPMLDDTVPRVRTEAVEALSDVGKGHPDVTTALLHMLTDTDPDMQARVRQTLRKIETQSFEEIAMKFQAHANDTSGVQVEAVQRQRKEELRQTEILTELLQTLTDSDPDMRVRAIEELKQIRDELPDSSEFILRILSDILDGTTFLQKMTDNYNSTFRRTISLRALDFLNLLSARQPEAIIVFRYMLTDSDWQIRIGGVKALAELASGQSEVTALLLQTLVDENSSVRGETAQALKKIGEGQPEVVQALLQTLTDPDWHVRVEGIKTLAEVGAREPTVVTTLLEMLSDPFSSVRMEAIQAIRKIGDRQPIVVTMLLQELAGSNPDRRVGIARALGSIKTKQPEIVTALRQIVTDSDCRIRAGAISSLAEIGVRQSEVTNILFQALTDDDSSVRIEAVQALRKIEDGQPEVVTALLRILADPDSNVQAAVIKVLGEIGTGQPVVIKALLQALTNSIPNIGAVVARALAEAGASQPEVVQALLHILTDADYDARAMAARALAVVGVGQPEVVQALLHALTDSDWHVRAEAAHALGEVGDDQPEVVQALLHTLTDSYAPVGRSASEALASLKIDSMACGQFVENLLLDTRHFPDKQLQADYIADNLLFALQQVVGTV